MSKKSKILLIIGLTIMISLVLLRSYLYQDHNLIEELDPKFIGKSKTIMEKVQSNYANWINIIVQVEGKITEIGKDGFLIDHKIYAHLDSQRNKSSIRQSESVIIKGRIIGYDELLDELKIDKCLIIKKEE